MKFRFDAMIVQNIFYLIIELKLVVDEWIKSYTLPTSGATFSERS
jgi:hypothetical protein